MSIKNIITYELSGKWYYKGGGGYGWGSGNRVLIMDSIKGFSISV